MAERPKEKRVLVALPRRHCVRIVFSISVATGCAVTCPGKKLQHYLIWDCDSLFLPDPSNPLFTRHPSRVSPPQLLLRHALSRLSSPHTMDHSRDPCPWVALSDFGGAFCMGVCPPNEHVYAHSHRFRIANQSWLVFRLSVVLSGMVSRVSATAPTVSAG